MSTLDRLFYADRLESHVHCLLLFIFSCFSLNKNDFLRDLCDLEISTATPGQSEGPGTNGNKKVLYTPQRSRIVDSPSDAV